MSQQYVFGGTEHESELRRLRAIEDIFDPGSEAILESTEIGNGWQCLEVGAGAGSVAKWISAKVGPEGKVTALDLNCRFLSHLSEDNISVLEGDFHTLDLHGGYDLVHARYVLVHDSTPAQTIARMLELLKPGGWIVLEEPDFSAARAATGPTDGVEAFEKVRQAIYHMYNAKGTDWSIGIKLPAILNQMRCENIFAEQEAPLTKGGSGIASMMRQSADQLKDKYLETQALSEQELEAYVHFTEVSSSWAVYYATIRVRGQKK